jgi:hypothetical protein
MRDGCRAAIDALHSDRNLAPEWTREQATDVFWTMLCVQNWEVLTGDCGWSNQQFVERMKILVKRTLMND